jgi:hypothetical protein
MYWPTPHFTHDSFPAASWWCPFKQSLHAVSTIIPSSLEYLPAEQALQPNALDTPTAAEYLPRVQFVHDFTEV